MSYNRNPGGAAPRGPPVGTPYRPTRFVRPQGNRAPNASAPGPRINAVVQPRSSSVPGVNRQPLNSSSSSIGSSTAGDVRPRWNSSSGSIRPSAAADRPQSTNPIIRGRAVQAPPPTSKPLAQLANTSVSVSQSATTQAQVTGAIAGGALGVKGPTQASTSVGLQNVKAQASVASSATVVAPGSEVQTVSAAQLVSSTSKASIQGINTTGTTLVIGGTTTVGGSQVTKAGTHVATTGAQGAKGQTPTTTTSATALQNAKAQTTVASVATGLAQGAKVQTTVASINPGAAQGTKAPAQVSGTITGSNGGSGASTIKQEVNVSITKEANVTIGGKSNVTTITVTKAPITVTTAVASTAQASKVQPLMSSCTLPAAKTQPITVTKYITTSAGLKPVTTFASGNVKPANAQLQGTYKLGVVAKPATSLPTSSPNVTTAGSSVGGIQKINPSTSVATPAATPVAKPQTTAVVPMDVEIVPGGAQKRKLSAAEESTLNKMQKTDDSSTGKGAVTQIVAKSSDDNDMVSFTRIASLFVVDYRLLTQEGPPHQPRFNMQITVDGRRFVGKGTSIKKAKNNAAENALVALGFKVPGITTTTASGPVHTTLNDSKTTTTSASTVASKTTTTVVSQPAPSATATTSTAAVSNPQSTDKNATQLLNELYAGTLTYQSIVSHVTSLPTCFTIRLVINGETYDGTASSKKAAKHECSAAALKGLTASGALAKMLLEKNKSKGKTQGGKAQTILQEVGRVSGLVVDPLLPTTTNPDLGGQTKSVKMFADSTAENTKPVNQAAAPKGGFGRLPGSAPVVPAREKSASSIIPSLLDLAGIGPGAMSNARGRGGGRGGGCAIPPPTYDDDYVDKSNNWVGSEGTNNWKSSGDGGYMGGRGGGRGFTAGPRGGGRGRGSFDDRQISQGNMSFRGGRGGVGLGRGGYNLDRDIIPDNNRFGSSDKINTVPEEASSTVVTQGLGHSELADAGRGGVSSSDAAGRGRGAAAFNVGRGGVSEVSSGIGAGVGRGILPSGGGVGIRGNVPARGGGVRGNLSGGNSRGGSRVNIMSCTGGRLAPPAPAAVKPPLTTEKTGFDNGGNSYDGSIRTVPSLTSGALGSGGGLNPGGNIIPKVRSLFGRTPDFKARMTAPEKLGASVTDSGSGYGSKNPGSHGWGGGDSAMESYPSKDANISTGSRLHMVHPRGEIGGTIGATGAAASIGFGANKFAGQPARITADKTHAYSTDNSTSGGRGYTSSYPAGGNYEEENMDYSTTADSYTFGVEPPAQGSYLTEGGYDSMTGSKSAYKQGTSYGATDEQFWSGSEYDSTATKPHGGALGNTGFAGSGSNAGFGKNLTWKSWGVQSETGNYGQQGPSLLAKSAPVGWKGAYSDYGKEGGLGGGIGGDSWNNPGALEFPKTNVADSRKWGAANASQGGYEAGNEYFTKDYTAGMGNSYATSGYENQGPPGAFENPGGSIYGSQGQSSDLNNYGYAGQTGGYENTKLNSYSTVGAMDTYPAVSTVASWAAPGGGYDGAKFSSYNTAATASSWAVPVTTVSTWAAPGAGYDNAQYGSYNTAGAVPSWAPPASGLAATANTGVAQFGRAPPSGYASGAAGSYAQAAPAGLQQPGYYY